MKVKNVFMQKRAHYQLEKTKDTVASDNGQQQICMSKLSDCNNSD